MEKIDLKTVYIAYGSNQGDWPTIKSECFKWVENKVGPILKKSNTYITKAWGKTDQPDFKNGALLVSTSLNASQCLQELKEIEKLLGREITEKWGPRIIDLDIIDFNNEIHNEPNLQTPHPLAHERQFVLQPLCDIDAELILPTHKVTVRQVLNQLTDKTELEVID